MTPPAPSTVTPPARATVTPATHPHVTPPSPARENDERLIDQRVVKILPHIELDMTRRINEQTSLQEKKYAASEIYGEDDKRVIDDLLPRNAQCKIVDGLTDKVRNE